MPTLNDQEHAQTHEVESPERRAALEKLGRYATYVPPTVLTLLVSTSPSAQSGLPGPPGPPFP